MGVGPALGRLLGPHVKTVVFAPMPMPSDSTTASVRVGVLARERRAVT